MSTPPDSPEASADLEQSFNEAESQPIPHDIAEFASPFPQNFEKYTEHADASQKPSVWKPLSEQKSRSGRVPRLTDLVIRRFAEDYHSKSRNA